MSRWEKGKKRCRRLEAKSFNILMTREAWSEAACIATNNLIANSSWETMAGQGWENCVKKVSMERWKFLIMTDFQLVTPLLPSRFLFKMSQYTKGSSSVKKNLHETFSPGEIEGKVQAKPPRNIVSRSNIFHRKISLYAKMEKKGWSNV